MDNQQNSIYLNPESSADTNSGAKDSSLRTLLKQRGVFVAGWSGLAEVHLPQRSPNLLVLDAIPHAWLFPRMAAVVHHAGSGTTGAGPRAGVPSVLGAIHG
jgi:UDP:flavonoid glycosyltransferase YjiC (YdhE family)